MSGHLLRPAAEQDLKDIWQYGVAEWSEARAWTYLNALFNLLDELSAFPFSGHDVGWIMPGYRRRHCGGHSVYYRVTDGGEIEIVRILHQQMDAAEGL
ncbi:type II toxin-antitoxin system RelE/ParE family toxin [Allorhizobium undicola]|uniref:type II toxin-antitoxin system RelE/ParE family toxin n=1 Tax=Allorhizobium undicola TaxID=78527 RepID=UPI003D345C94